MSVNKAILVGRLGRDPESKATQSGMEVCKMSIATSRKRNGEEHTEWHRVTAFGKTAEACSRYLAKGREVYIEGRIQTTSYEKNGEKRYSTEIVADTVQFLGGKVDSAYPDASGPVSSRFGGSPPAPYDPGDGDDIPF